MSDSNERGADRELRRILDEGCPSQTDVLEEIQRMVTETGLSYETVRVTVLGSYCEEWRKRLADLV